jgi:hypothetical protein
MCASSPATMLAYEDPELGARLKGRYLGWGSGGPARLELLRTVRGKEVADRAGASPPGGRVSLHILERRDPPSYSRGYSGFLNPLYEPGMSHLQIAERWLAAEARRRPNFKQQLQNLEHGADLGQKGWVENEIESLLKRTGNPWHIAFEDVAKDLFVTSFTCMDGFRRMVWTTAHFDRNHWNPEQPMKSIGGLAALGSARVKAQTTSNIATQDITCDNGMLAFLAYPASGGSFPTVILMHERYGLVHRFHGTDHMRGIHFS